MSRRIIALLVAVVLAIIAILLVLRYVSQAEERAISELSPANVLVITEEVPAGTEAADLSEYVTLEEVPSSALVPGSLESLEEVDGKLTITDFFPGEQVLVTRFATAEELSGEVQIPEGYHEVTVQLSTTRVIGGHLNAGDTVGFFASDEELKETVLALHKVLVTRVQGGVVTTESEDGTETTQPAADSLMVTLAVAADDTLRVVNASEFYNVWLSLEPEEAPEDLDIFDREDLFQ